MMTTNEGQAAPENPPSPDRRITGWLANANNVLTATGAIVASLAALFASFNKGAIEKNNGAIEKNNGAIERNNAAIAQVDAKVRDLELKQATEKASTAFANVFLQDVLSDERIKDSPKRVQALLSILNIVAQASASKTGESSAKARALMPMQLALLLGEPGGLAAMDGEYTYFDDWVALALADNSNLTRVTAVQALAGVCQKALRAGRLDVVSKGAEAVKQLLDLIPEDQATNRAPAVAARTQLASFIIHQHQLLDSAVIPGGNPQVCSRVREKLRSSLQNALTDALALRSNLQRTVTQLEDSNPPDLALIEEVRKNLALIDAALKMATQVTVEKVAETAEVNATSDASANGDPIEIAVSKIIPDLASENPDKRRKASSDLALFGQSAVEPLLREVSKRYTNGSLEEERLRLSVTTSLQLDPLLGEVNKLYSANSREAYRVRLGVATALQLMRQPIQLDITDAYWVVNLLQSPDADTRNAASDFVISLGSGSSIRNCFNELEKLFYILCESPASKQGGDTVLNAVTIVATWARVSTPDIPSREPDKSFRQFALENAETWKKTLESSKSQPLWENTIFTLNDLINRAKARTK